MSKDNSNDTMHMIVAVKLGEKIVFVEPQNDAILRYDELGVHYNNNFDFIVIYGFIGDFFNISLGGWMSEKMSDMFEVKI